MKKAISLLLVLVVAFGMSSVAFAASDIPGTYDARNNYAGTHNNAGTHNAVNNYAGTPNAGTNSFAGRSLTAASNDTLFLPEPSTPYAMPGTPYATNGTTIPTYTIGANELFLVYNNGIIGADTELRPDETYKFDIYHTKIGLTSQTATNITNNANVKKVTKAELGTGTIKVRTVKGSSAIQSAKIRTVGTGTQQTYRLEIITRPNYGTSTTDLEYVLYVVDPTNAAYSFADSTHTFTVGFNEISESQTDVGEEGTITISNDAPVITKDQFADIAKSANYKNVIFESDDSNWSFKGKVAGMKSTNFSFNYDPDTDLMNKFPDQEFKFVNFPAGVNFPTTGEMRIDVSDVSDDFRTMYAYLYRNGQLTEIDSTYDSGADQLVFRTNYLGRFVITNRPITDTSLVPDEETEEEFEEEYIPVPEVPSTNNPATGAGSANAMAALGLVVLASAAVVSKKRG